MNCPAMPPGGGMGMKFRKPLRPKTRKITPARYRAIVETVLITGFLLFDWRPLHDANPIDVNIVDELYFGGIQEFYDQRRSGAGPCLACHDVGDARPAEVRSRRYG